MDNSLKETLVISSTCRLIVCRVATLSFAVTFCLSGQLFSELHAQNQTVDLERQFAEDAPKAWEKYKSRASRLQGTAVFKRFRLTPERTLTSDRKCEFKQKPGRALFMQQDFGTIQVPEKDGFLQVTNPDGAFEIRRFAADKPWVLTNIARSSGKSPPFLDPADSVERWTTCPITFSSIYDPLRIVTHESGYKATEFTVVDLDGQRCVKVQFSYTPDGKNPRLPAIKGYAVYNPDKYWVAREYNVAMSWAVRPEIAASTVVKMEYVESSDGFPILRRLLQKLDTQGKGKENHADWTYEFNLAEGDVPDDVFTLATYVFSRPRDNLRRYWIIGLAIAGLAFLLTAVLIRRRRVKHPT
jgi:hypothetical protein